MAAVVRVKRRRDADPAESLLISCKRHRQNDPNSETDVSENGAVSGVFKFAATVSDKEAERISLHIRDAIRKDKLEKEYKHHQFNVDLPGRVRREQRVAAEHNRYRVIAQRRALNLEDLDLNLQEVPLLNNQEQNGQVPQPQPEVEVEEPQQPKVSKKRNRDDVQEDEKKASAEENNFKFCLYDLEADSDEKKKTKQMKVAPEGITCNGIVMEKIPVASSSTAEGEQNRQDYVYDLYYLNKRDFDFRMLENILAIEAYNNDFIDYRHAEDDDYVDDDDDSNDEGNWRNDYPEEDPHFYENEGAEYFVGDDGHGFKKAFAEDDEVWDMSEKFQQGFFSKDDADEDDNPYYDSERQVPLTSFESYKKRILRELGEDDEKDGDT